METLGYTTGVFDLFHIGHLNVLKRARAHCDKLIVGVTTDELCQSHKGHPTVIPFDERIEIIRNLSMVDEAVPQDSMDKMAAWDCHRFHRMFVGDDWKGTPAWNQIEMDFAEVGVSVVYFPYTSTTSSTILRTALRKIVESVPA